MTFKESKDGVVGGLLGGGIVYESKAACPIMDFAGETGFLLKEVLWVPVRTRMGQKLSFQLEGYGTQSFCTLSPVLPFRKSNLSGLCEKKRPAQSPLVSV